MFRMPAYDPNAIAVLGFGLFWRRRLHFAFDASLNAGDRPEPRSSHAFSVYPERQ